MTTETHTYTKEDLCRLLENKATFAQYRIVDGILQGLYYGSWIKILSIGDTIKADECERCGHDKFQHYPFCVKEKDLICRTVILTSKGKYRNCKCKRFKPHLRRVVKIRLLPSSGSAISRLDKLGEMVETCKCGHVEIQHRNIAGGKMGCHAETVNYETGTAEDEFCSCKQYEPEQRVELVIE